MCLLVGRSVDAQGMQSVKFPGGLFHQLPSRLAFLADDEAGCKGLRSPVGPGSRKRGLCCHLAMRHEVVQRSQRGLNLLQPVGKSCKLLLVTMPIKAPEEIDGVADFLDLDAQLVSLTGVEIVQMPALLSSLSDLPGEQFRGVGGNRSLIVGTRPCSLDPLEQVDQQTAVPCRRNGIARPPEGYHALRRDLFAERV